MAEMRVHICTHASGWRLQWHVDGVPSGDPVDIAAQAANQLGYLGSAIAQAFEHRSADGFARLPLMPTSALDHTGAQLRDLCCRPIIGRLGDGGKHRLTVAGDVPAALNLPWELLPVGNHGERLGCQKDWGVFRTPAGAPSPPPVRRGGPLRILFLAAAPTDQQQLHYEKEEEAILRATATLQGALLFTAELGSYDELDKLLLRVKPHIVHLSGHGALGNDGVGRFCFEDDAGHTDARAAGDLARLFLDRDVPCVFLNGCQTSQAAVAGLCQALTAAGLPLALGWAASVADERATAFAETFYQALLGGEPVPAAAALARLRIQRDGIRKIPGRDEEQELTFLLPQLYAARPVEVLFDPREPRESFQGVETRYELLPGGVKGLREGFVGRRREQQRLVPALREGRITFLLLHGVAGQGKSTLATRLVDRLRGEGFKVRAVLTRQQGDTAASCAARAAVDIVREISLEAALLGQEQAGTVLSDETKPLARRLLLAVDVLTQLKCALVLDNFEDVQELGTDGAWHIADAGLAEFYARVQTQLTSPDGGRVVVTSRYLPAETRADVETVRVLAGLNDFKDYEFFKLLKGDKQVAPRIARGELPVPLLERLYAFAGGTPRFLERLRTLLRTFAAGDLEAALDSGSGTLVEARDKYLEEHFGPKLFGLLSDSAQTLVARLGLSQLPLPVDALAALTGLESAALTAAVKQGVEFGLLQLFEAADSPALVLPPGLWRGWLAEQLPGPARTVAHGVLAEFWRAVYAKDREGELRIRVEDGLQACRVHAKYAGNRELQLWASVQLAGRWERIAEWRAARAVLEEIPDGELDGAAWHLLATLDVNEGHYAAAREKFGKALAIKQQIGDRQVEAGTWHQLATIELIEGNYAAAREKFGKALAIVQQIGNRQGEAATWHQLASVDVEEGNYAAAREKFGKSLAIEQQIGNRQGEAATWHQLASIDVEEGNYAAAREKFGKSLAINQQIGDRYGEGGAFYQLGSLAAEEEHVLPGAKLVGVCFLIDQAIGHGDTQKDLRAFLGLCARLKLAESEVPALLEEIGAAYQKDRGYSLLKEAFPDWV